MKNAQSSDRVSNIASRVLRKSLPAMVQIDGTKYVILPDYQLLLADAKTLAASVLRQDEQRGLRRLLRKVVGR